MCLVVWEATAVPTVSRRRVGMGRFMIFLAGSGRVNRNSSDVLELGYSSGNLRKQNPTQLFRWPAASWVKKVGGAGDTVNFWQNSRESCKFPTTIIGACPEFRDFWRKFLDKNKIFLQFFDSPKFREGQLPPCRPWHEASVCLDSAQSFTH